MFSVLFDFNCYSIKELAGIFIVVNNFEAKVTQEGSEDLSQ